MAGLAEWRDPDLLVHFIEHAPVTIAMFDTEMRYFGASARWRSDYGVEGLPLEGDERDGILELQARAGMYTHRNGPHARVPIGQFKIGRIAARRAPDFTSGDHLDRLLAFLAAAHNARATVET